MLKTQTSFWNEEKAYSSRTEEWATPQNLFDQLDKEFKFTLDPCASKDNYKCKKYFTIRDDGLNQDWGGVVFMNPPYGRQIKLWVKKAYQESLKGVVVVCLIPARTDTIYWHKYIFPFAKDIRFLKGRLKFVKDGKIGDPAPFPSAVVIFKGEKDAE
jgi:site-specific DNA-methyltransferase (adenine-specific)